MIGYGFLFIILPITLCPFLRPTALASSPYVVTIPGGTSSRFLYTLSSSFKLVSSQDLLFLKMKLSFVCFYPNYSNLLEHILLHCFSPKCVKTISHLCDLEHVLVQQYPKRIDLQLVLL